MAKAIRKTTEPKKSVKLVTSFRHYRTGKVMHAADYGYKAWPIGIRSGSARRAAKGVRR